VEARIELHQRFALPLACLLLALCGVPLGVSSRKGGKSAAIVITVFFAFLYYMSLVSLIGLAREGRLAPEVAVWLPNAGFALMAVLLLARLERPGDFDLIEWLRGWVRASLGPSAGRDSERRRAAPPPAHERPPLLSAAPGDRHIRAVGLSVLFRDPAHEFCTADRGL
jgi:hypothetical protein